MQLTPAIEPADLETELAPAKSYTAVRAMTESLCAPLATEDYVIQSAPECSPAKWHLAHTTWFFEHFILQSLAPGYIPFRSSYGHLFNSYYETVGTFFPRSKRGLLSRPTVEEVFQYRAHVDRHMHDLLSTAGSASELELMQRLVLGLNHEQQHQELLLTDIKNLFALNPLHPVYQDAPHLQPKAVPLAWMEFSGGMQSVGHAGVGFAFDNETPRHRVYLEPFALASRPVANGEWLEFMRAGGYSTPELWLSDGWRTVQQNSWQAPLYWEQTDEGWGYMTLGGFVPVDPEAPVCHVSYFEADAYARFAGHRLPTEFEWEVAASSLPLDGNFMDSRLLHPSSRINASRQFFGDVWEWTSSAYMPYPGYKPLAGSLGEYNGKFMVSQLVLRGGSCATPRSHIRSSYRNFFYPPDRWQFTGLRLAR
jgi:ergothioneine biosynthesis protein EgtB